MPAPVKAPPIDSAQAERLCRQRYGSALRWIGWSRPRDRPHTRSWTNQREMGISDRLPFMKKSNSYVVGGKTLTTRGTIVSDDQSYRAEGSMHAVPNEEPGCPKSGPKSRAAS